MPPKHSNQLINNTSKRKVSNQKFVKKKTSSNKRSSSKKTSSTKSTTRSTTRSITKCTKEQLNEAKQRYFTKMIKSKKEIFVTWYNDVTKSHCKLSSDDVFEFLKMKKELNKTIDESSSDDDQATTSDSETSEEDEKKPRKRK